MTNGFFLVICSTFCVDGCESTCPIGDHCKMPHEETYWKFMRRMNGAARQWAKDNNDEFMSFIKADNKWLMGKGELDEL